VLQISCHETMIFTKPRTTISLIYPSETPLYKIKHNLGRKSFWRISC